MIFLIKLKINLVLIRHLIKRLSNQKFLEINLTPIDKIAKFIHQEIISSEIILHMYLILCMIHKNIPILHEVIIENDNLKVFILPKLYLFIRHTK